MATNTVRTIVIFGIIALLLGGAAIGLVRVMKARDTSHATSNQPVAVNPPQAEQKQAPQKEQPQSNQKTDTKTDQPAASTPQASNAPTQTDAGATPTTMPATGAGDFSITIVLMALAAFFGMKLMRVRATYRRHIGLSR